VPIHALTEYRPALSCVEDHRLLDVDSGTAFVAMGVQGPAVCNEGEKPGGHDRIENVLGIALPTLEAHQLSSSLAELRVDVFARSVRPFGAAGLASGHRFMVVTTPLANTCFQMNRTVAGLVKFWFAHFFPFGWPPSQGF
jgi:hypothetical protein